MKNQNARSSGLFPVVTVLCLAASLVLCYVMLWGGSRNTPAPSASTTGVSTSAPSATPAPSAASETQGVALTVTESQLAALLTAASSASYPLEDCVVHIEPDQITVEASISRSSLSTLSTEMDSSNVLTDSVISLLPEKVAFGACLSLKVEAEQLVITPRSMTVGGITVDAALLPDMLQAPLQQALTDATGSLEQHIADVQLSQGVLTVWLI